MSNTYTITIVVGPHEDAQQFAEYLLGEVEYRVDNEKELVGVPVTFGLSPEVECPECLYLYTDPDEGCDACVDRKVEV